MTWWRDIADCMRNFCARVAASLAGRRWCGVGGLRVSRGDIHILYSAYLTIISNQISVEATWRI